MRFVLLALLLLPLQLWAADPAEDGMPVLQRFEVSEYTESSQVWRALQLRDGTLVFAAHTGLLRYDGERFEFLGGRAAPSTIWPRAPTAACTWVPDKRSATSLPTPSANGSGIPTRCPRMRRLTAISAVSSSSPGRCFSSRAVMC